MDIINIYINGEPSEVKFINEGFYGTIFRLKNEDVVFKVFKRKESSAYEDFITENTFRSEVVAYERLMGDEILKKYVPHFYGTFKIDYIEINGKNEGEKYRCDLVYKIQYIEQKFKKIGLNTSIKSLIEPFKKLNINYLKDADYCHSEERYKFIDFGLIGVREEIENNFYDLRLSDFDATKRRFYQMHPYLNPNENISMRKNGNTETTQIGYVNRNNQKVLGTRSVEGNDHLQYSYKVECQISGCGYIYGVNGTDLFQRKCPQCQNGHEGIEY